MCSPGPINIPAADSTLPTAEVPVLLKQIAAYVVKGLPDFFKAHTELLPAGDQKPHEYGALKIALKGETGMMSYKAAWEVEAAQISLKSTGMYEASANLLWLNPFPRTTMAQQIAGNPPSWSQLTEAVALFMTNDAAQEQTLAEAPLAPSQGRHKRIMRMISPLAVPAHCEQADSGGATGILGMFDVVTGHLYLWAWYLGMYQAMRAEDATLVASLWQMALTTSVHLRHGLSESKLAIWSIQSAEQSRFQDGVLGDTFPAFAMKCLPTIGELDVSNSKAQIKMAEAGWSSAARKPTRRWRRLCCSFAAAWGARRCASWRRSRLRTGATC